MASATSRHFDSMNGPGEHTSPEAASARATAIHGYADIDRTVLWKTATAEVPALLPLLRALIGTST
jgi:hypothetical protein